MGRRMTLVNDRAICATFKTIWDYPWDDLDKCGAVPNHVVLRLGKSRESPQSRCRTYMPVRLSCGPGPGPVSRVHAIAKRRGRTMHIDILWGCPYDRKERKP